MEPSRETGGVARPQKVCPRWHQGPLSFAEWHESGCTSSDRELTLEPTFLPCSNVCFLSFKCSGCAEAVCSGWPQTVLHWRAYCQVAREGQWKLNCDINSYCWQHIFHLAELKYLDYETLCRWLNITANSRISHVPSRHGTSPQRFLRPSYTVLAWRRPCTSPTVKSEKAPPSLRCGADGCGVNAASPAAGRSAATASTATTWGSSVDRDAWRRVVSWDSVWRWGIKHSWIFAHVYSVYTGGGVQLTFESGHFWEDFNFIFTCFFKKNIKELNLNILSAPKGIKVWFILSASPAEHSPMCHM